MSGQPCRSPIYRAVKVLQRWPNIQRARFNPRGPGATPASLPSPKGGTDGHIPLLAGRWEAVPSSARTWSHWPGFEPATRALQKRRSTTELQRLNSSAGDQPGGHALNVDLSPTKGRHLAKALGFEPRPQGFGGPHATATTRRCMICRTQIAPLLFSTPSRVRVQQVTRQSPTFLPVYRAPPAGGQ